MIVESMQEGLNVDKDYYLVGKYLTFNKLPMKAGQDPEKQFRSEAKICIGITIMDWIIMAEQGF
jgi:hypothetical protein